jgi:biotin carboxyl carrier protein
MMRNRISAVKPLIYGVSLSSLLTGCLQKQVERVREREAAQSSAEPSHVTEENGEVGVTLDSATVARIRLQTVALRAFARADETDLPGVIVPDPEATTLVRAGVAGRLALLEGGSWPRFGTRLDRGDPVGVIGDARPVTASRTGTVSRVFVQPGDLVQPGQELLEITSYDAPLVRVAWNAALPPPPGAMGFSTGTTGPRVQGTMAGPAPEADPVTREPAWLYRITGGWRGMRPGVSVTAHLAETRALRHGVLVPSSAVVQWDALSWTFQERAPGRFVRVRVPTDRPVPGGWLVTAPLSVGDRVVTSGAGQLLSEEFRARIVVGEEVGE